MDELNEARSKDGRRPVVAIYMTGWAIDSAHNKQRHTNTLTDTAATELHATDATEPQPSCASHRRHPLSSLSPSQYCSGDTMHPCGLHLLPYSSHSSYSELQAFLSHARPRSILPISAPLTATSLYSAYLDATPATCFTPPAELVRATLIDAEWMRRRGKPRATCRWCGGDAVMLVG